MDKIKLTDRTIYDYEKYTFNDLLKKYNIGIDKEQMVKSFKELLPTMDEYGWWPGKKEHQAQFAVQSRLHSENPYSESCGPQPTLAKDCSKNYLTEASYKQINELFKGTYFEEIINIFPVNVVRCRFVRLSGKSCYRFHRDMTYKFHIPIITNTSNMMIWPEQSHRHIVHMPSDGCVYFTETSIPHTALNGSTDYRYHMVLSSDTKRSEIFKKMKKYEISFDRTNYPSLDPEGVWR